MAIMGEMETILAPSQVTEGCCMWGFGFCLCAVCRRGYRVRSKLSRASVLRDGTAGMVGGGHVDSCEADL